MVEALRHFGLAFEFLQIGIQFTQYVFYAGQVFTGVAQAIFGFAAAFLVFGYTGCLLQKQAQFFRLGFDNAADGALADDGVGTRAQTGTQKNVLHVAATHRLVVDVVTAGAVACQHPFDSDFLKLIPLSAGAVGLVVKHQLDTGAAGRFAGIGAVEDDVLHGLAAQFAGPAFAQHPTHGIDDVGFTAAVGADHTDKLSRQ